MALIKGTFTSYWSEGLVSTPCILDDTTGELTPETVDAGDLGTLKNEKFEAENGDENDVCMICHEYIKKGKMLKARTGKTLYEEQVCMNPNCESHEEE